MKKFKNNSN